MHAYRQGYFLKTSSHHRESFCICPFLALTASNSTPSVFKKSKIIQATRSPASFDFSYVNEIVLLSRGTFSPRRSIL